MAALAEAISLHNPELVAEQRYDNAKSFDVLASVRAFRYDQENFGRVLPETRRQVADEELSLLVEGVDRSARTEFLLTKQGDDLAFYKNGRWQSYTGMLITGQAVAAHEANADPRKQFLADAADKDLAIGYRMRQLRPGQQFFWSSAYDHDAEAQYGAEFMESCGRFPDRKMAFLYRAYCDRHGNVVMQSQTVDNSDDEAISAALEMAQSNPCHDLDDAVMAYDAVLERKHGGRFYAGRQDGVAQENAWLILQQHTDLIDYLLDGLESMAAGPLSDVELELKTKKHIYGVWAAFKKRLDTGTLPTNSAGFAPLDPGLTIAWQQPWELQQEVQQAFNSFAKQGIAMVGCGGQITISQGESDILAMESKDTFDVIFGADEDKYGSLEFECPKGCRNRRPRGKLIDNCQKCGQSVRC